MPMSMTVCFELCGTGDISSSIATKIFAGGLGIVFIYPKRRQLHNYSTSDYFSERQAPVLLSTSKVDIELVELWEAQGRAP